MIIYIGKQWVVCNYSLILSLFTIQSKRSADSFQQSDLGAQVLMVALFPTASWPLAGSLESSSHSGKQTGGLHGRFLGVRLWTGTHHFCSHFIPQNPSRGQPIVQTGNRVWLSVQEEQEKGLVNICAQKQEGRKYVPCRDQRMIMEGGACVTQLISSLSRRKGDASC